MKSLSLFVTKKKIMADEVRLIDIVEKFVSGDWGEENATSESPCAVSCVRGADIVPISNSRFEIIPVRYISTASFKNRRLTEGDIIIEKSGGSPTQSTGRTVYVSKKLVEAKKNIVCSNFCQAFRIKQDWNPLYVYYYLQVVYNSGVFFNFEGKTSGLKNRILDSACQSITIKKVPLEEQDRVANILSLIDDKIAANHAINDYLEAMARQLYDYWFVQFDFPDENGKPYKSSGGKMVWNEKLKREIPDRWAVVNVFDGANVLYGFPFSTESFSEKATNKPIVRIRDILEGSVSAYTTECVDEKYRLNKGDVVIGMDGNFHMNIWQDDNAYLNQRCVRIRPKPDTTVSSIQILYDAKPYINAREQTIKGSTVGHLSDKDMKLLQILVAKGNKFFSPRPVFDTIVDEISKNRIEISNLMKQRDELLPLLMNSQVSVKPLNNHLSAD